ncbi:hypothetical protein B0H19DRAFT_1270430 [Mycena capillaripes]|nr:hypothetical protein B0H19DRAFT_1270430 [Mycena capillaripes]
MTDTTLCCSSTPGEGCNGYFPNKTAPGLCAKCTSLDNATSEEMKTKIESIPQCAECGALGQYIKNEKCASCLRKEKSRVSQQNASQAQNAALITRPNAFSARNLAPPQAKHSPVVKRTPGERMITICIEAFHLQTNKPIGWLGCNSRAFTDRTMFGDAITELLQAFNASFETRSQVSLGFRDVIIRWHGNLSFHPSSECGTVGEFYDIHFRLHNSATFLRMPPKFKVTAQPAIALAMFIDPIRFKENHGLQPPLLDDKVRKGKGKRRVSDSFEEPEVKRHAPSKPLTSSYLPTMSQVMAAAPPFSSVTLKFLAFQDDDDIRIFPWPGPATLAVRLYNDPMIVGKDKAVFKMEVDGVIYVAKRWRQAPTNAADFHRNSTNIERNIFWLHVMSLALGRFSAVAETHGFEDHIYDGFEAQPSFCAAEVLDNTAPSVASGVSAVALKAAQDEHQATSPEDVSVSDAPQILWLIQRYNGKTQERCNLLKPQTHPPNKIDATLLALTHFFWNEYRTDEVMSHYQIAPGKMSNGEYGKLIFDALAQDDTKFNPRRHTDEGAKAAQTVKALHQCPRICGLFDLGSAGDEETEVGSGKASDEDEDEDQ